MNTRGAHTQRDGLKIVSKSKGPVSYPVTVTDMYLHEFVYFVIFLLVPKQNKKYLLSVQQDTHSSVRRSHRARRV